MRWSRSRDDQLVADAARAAPDAAPGVRRRARRARRRGLPAARRASAARRLPFVPRLRDAAAGAPRRLLSAGGDRTGGDRGRDGDRRRQRAGEEPSPSAAARRDRSSTAEPSRNSTRAPYAGSGAEPRALRRQPSSGRRANLRRSRNGSQARSARRTSSESARPTRSGPYACASAGHRDVERSAEIGPRRRPDEVADDAAKVFEAVHAADGIVLQLLGPRAATAGDAGATFDLLIPSAKLGDALAAFSAIAEVRSRHEATDDITAPTVGAGNSCATPTPGSTACWSSSPAAETEAEREAVEARAARRAPPRRRACARQLHKLHRAPTSRGSRCGSRPAPASPPTSGGGWGVGDALHDAGHILGDRRRRHPRSASPCSRPLALIALLAWLANRVWVRRAASAPSTLSRR